MTDPVEAAAKPVTLSDQLDGYADLEPCPVCFMPGPGDPVWVEDDEPVDLPVSVRVGVEGKDAT